MGPAAGAPTAGSPNPGATLYPLDPSLVGFEPLPPAPPKAHRRWARAVALLLLTFVFTTTIGALWKETDGIPIDSTFWASPAEIARVWGDGELRALGLAYSIPLLIILLAHELGHYLACVYYRLPATLPYFLPFPLGLGTMGAFIRIKAPIRRKKALFDVGIAGPIAGFVALLPFLLYGIAHSSWKPLEDFLRDGPSVVLGANLAMVWTIEVFHGSFPRDMVLDLHPSALAAWVGLLATALNLIPVGQLDGGHIFYAALPRWQHRTALPLWLLLAVAGLLWPVWWIWCLFLLLMGIRHPPVRDVEAPLGPGRWLLAVAAFLIFVVTFMPAPVGVQGLAPG